MYRGNHLCNLKNSVACTKESCTNHRHLWVPQVTLHTIQFIINSTCGHKTRKRLTMAKPRANNKRLPTPAKGKKGGAPKPKAARTSMSTGSPPTTPTANLKRPPPDPEEEASEAQSVNSDDAQAATHPTASIAETLPVSSVHVPGTGATGTDDLTDAAEASSAAYCGVGSAYTKTKNMAWTIRNYVTTDFFPSVKFITSKSKLAYYPRNTNPDSFCARVTKGCNLPLEEDHANWWETLAKGVLKRKISQLRSDRINSIRKEYLGKW